MKGTKKEKSKDQSKRKSLAKKITLTKSKPQVQKPALTKLCTIKRLKTHKNTE
jgi:hypothetical protein